MTEDGKLPFTAHLEELRKRLITCFIAIGIGFAISFAFKEKLFQILAAPLQDAFMEVMKRHETLKYMALPEAFFTYLKVALLSGFMIATPVILYQFWLFVAPGLYNKERKLLLPIVLLSTLFFVGGSMFGYFIVFPLGFEFFLKFSNSTISMEPRMNEYFSFSSKLLFAFGLIFELPLVLTFLAKLGVVSKEFLTRNRKYAILIFFVGGAILTPPDPVTQVLMALPLIVLYEISIIGARIFGKKKPEDLDPTDHVKESK